jgi:hypothetical protein
MHTCNNSLELQVASTIVQALKWETTQHLVKFKEKNFQSSIKINKIKTTTPTTPQNCENTISLEKKVL